MTSVFCIQCESSLSETKAKDPGRKRCSVSSWIRALKEIALLSAWTYFPSYERHLTKSLHRSWGDFVGTLECFFLFLAESRFRAFQVRGGFSVRGERTSWQSISFEISKFMWLSVECVSEPEKESKLLHSQAAGQTSTETLKNTSRPQEPCGLLGKKRLLT